MGIGGMAPCFLNLSTRWSGQLHAPASLIKSKEIPVCYAFGCIQKQRNYSLQLNTPCSNHEYM